MLEKLSCEGYKIIFTKIMDPDPSHYNYTDLMKYMNMCTDLNVYTYGRYMPVRLKGIHFTNTVPAVNILMRMMKPFIQKNLLEMIHFHSTAESLAGFIPLDVLPNEDGGNAGNLTDIVTKTVKWLKNNRAWFQIDEATMRVNESLRPGKGKTSTDVFGVEASFKKLEVD